jgi:hypothetical protein
VLSVTRLFSETDIEDSIFLWLAASPHSFPTVETVFWLFNWPLKYSIRWYCESLHVIMLFQCEDQGIFFLFGFTWNSGKNKMSIFFFSSSVHLNALKFHIFTGFSCLCCTIGIQHNMSAFKVWNSLARFCIISQICFLCYSEACKILSLHWCLRMSSKPHCNFV